MALPDVTEKWAGKVLDVSIGVEPNQVTVGGQTTLPYLNFEGDTPNSPVVAMEVLDADPTEWTPVQREPFGDVLDNPADWAKKCVGEFGADMISIMLKSIHPDFGDASVDHAVDVVGKVSEAVDVPLIVFGCGDAEKDNVVLPPVAEALKGKNAALGSATETNYKTISAACQMAGHNLITESPCDINIAKQVNILVSENGFPLERVIMYPTTGALGYGFEYVYSIMERSRIAALSGDKMMAPPVICLVGPEVWRVKEALSPMEEQPHWGPESERGPMWEAMTASTLFMAGADIMVIRHPKAAAAVKNLIGELMKK